MFTSKSDAEVSKYRKKSKQSPFTKANHKHDYSEDVLIHNASNSVDWYSLRCTVCGKVKETKGIITIPHSLPHTSILLSNESVLKLYGNLPIVEIR